jgi:predicted RNase H-like nuclease
MKQRQDPATKPYYKCLSCPRFRKTCGGIPTRDMDLKEWCEYMRDVKDLAHLTNAYIAKEADVSIKTIERIMAINTEQDIMRATARRIERVVIGPVGEHFCYQDYKDDTSQEQIKRLLAEVEFWKKAHDRNARIIDKLLGP